MRRSVFFARLIIEILFFYHREKVLLGGGFFFYIYVCLVSSSFLKIFHFARIRTNTLFLEYSFVQKLTYALLGYVRVVNRYH